MEWSPWEAHLNNKFPGFYGTERFLVPCLKSLPQDLIMSKMNPVHMKTVPCIITFILSWDMPIQSKRPLLI
jgi:hypothetical protein